VRHPLYGHPKSKKTRRVGWFPMRYNADKYFGNYFDPVQLCNLKKDPFEKVNLADNPEYESVIKEMRANLVEQIEALKTEQAELVMQ
jgi:hypothetical protein